MRLAHPSFEEPSRERSLHRSAPRKLPPRRGAGSRPRIRPARFAHLPLPARGERAGLGGRRTMLSGVYRFPAMDTVVFGKPFVEALTKELDRLEARAVFILASGA